MTENKSLENFLEDVAISPSKRKRNFDHFKKRIQLPIVKKELPKKPPKTLDYVRDISLDLLPVKPWKMEFTLGLLYNARDRGYLFSKIYVYPVRSSLICTYCGGLLDLRKYVNDGRITKHSLGCLCQETEVKIDKARDLVIYMMYFLFEIRNEMIGGQVLPSYWPKIVYYDRKFCEDELRRRVNDLRGNNSGAFKMYIPKEYNDVNYGNFMESVLLQVALDPSILD